MLDIEDLKERLKPFLSKYDLSSMTDEQYTKMVEITREPLTLLSDITNDVAYFFGKDVEIDPQVQADVLDTETSQEVLKTFFDNFILNQFKLQIMFLIIIFWKSMSWLKLSTF